MPVPIWDTSGNVQETFLVVTMEMEGEGCYLVSSGRARDALNILSA